MKWLLCFGFFFSFLHGVEENKDERKDFFKDEHFHFVINGTNHLAFELLKTYESRQSNFCLSPYAIASGLAQIFIGAKHETANEMQRVLNFTPGFSPLMGTLDQFFSQHSPLKNEAKVFLASRVWIQEGISIIPAYQFALKRDFNSQVESVDFKRGFVNSIRLINQWMAKKTENQVTQVITTQDINDKTQLTVTTAFALKGAWQNPFDRKETTKEPFHINEKQTRQVEMMHADQTFAHFSDEKIDLIEIPFLSQKEHAKLSLLILLPKETMGWKTLLKELDKDQWETWEAGLRSKNLQLSIPRFRVEERVDLDSVLQTLGMKVAFTQNANFTGISESQGLSLSPVMHKNLLKIDEYGSSATFISAIQKTAEEEKKGETILKIDHPFFFFVLDRATGCILSIGRINQP